MKCRITDWSKRKDHRHHAIDALVVACTRQGYIQRLNRLSSEADREEMRHETELRKEPTADKLSLLERWLSQRPHFSVQDVSDKVAEILISYPKPKRTHTWGRNRYKKKTADGKEKTCIQTRVLVPRGELMEASLYGKIISDGKERIVKRYPLHALKGTVVDPRLRELITQRKQGSTTEAKGAPLYLDEKKKQEVRSVRCYAAKLSTDKAIPICFDEQGKAITFVQSRNNHHVVHYLDAAGKTHPIILSIWDVIERVRYGLPTIITDYAQVPQDLELPASVRDKLPQAEWKCMDVLLRNEMFLLGLSDEEITQAITRADYTLLSKHLYQLRKISISSDKKIDYTFYYHLDAPDPKKEKKEQGDKKKEKEQSKPAKGTSLTLHKYRVQGLSTFLKLNIHKVRIDLLGRITLL